MVRTAENGLPEPDAVIFLDLPIEKAVLRGAFGEERYEKEEFQRKVYENFMCLKTPEQVLDGGALRRLAAAAARRAATASGGSKRASPPSAL